jgi:hypothetical protein
VTFLDEPGPRAVVLTSSFAQRILDTARSDSDPGWKIFEARGFNAAKGSLIDLTLLVKP